MLRRSKVSGSKYTCDGYAKGLELWLIRATKDDRMKYECDSRSQPLSTCSVKQSKVLLLLLLTSNGLSADMSYEEFKLSQVKWFYSTAGLRLYQLMNKISVRELTVEALGLIR